MAGGEAAMNEGEAVAETELKRLCGHVMRRCFCYKMPGLEVGRKTGHFQTNMTIDSIDYKMHFVLVRDQQRCFKWIMSGSVRQFVACRVDPGQVLFQGTWWLGFVVSGVGASWIVPTKSGPSLSPLIPTPMPYA